MASPVKGLTFRGTVNVTRNMRKLGNAAIPAAVRTIVPIAETVMGEAKEECPVKDGHLRNSGHVGRPQVFFRSVRVTMGFGGTAAKYAIRQHEDETLRHTVGKAKYLGDPVNRMRPNYPRLVVRGLEREMRRAA